MSDMAAKPQRLAMIRPAWGGCPFSVPVGLARAWLASPTGTLNGQPPQAGLIIASLCGLAAMSDISMILRGGVSGPARIARHLWRLCLAFLVAWLSFTAQPRAQPEFLRNSPILMIPALLVLIAMAWWLVKLALERRRPRAAPMAAAATA